MAASSRGLSSNLIIHSEATTPKISKLGEINNRLSSIYAMMKRINDYKATIRVDLSGSTKALSSLRDIIKVSGAAFKSIPREQRKIAPQKAESTPFSPGAIPPFRGETLSQTKRERQTKKGKASSVSTESVEFVGIEERLRTVTESDSAVEDKIKRTNLELQGERRRRAKQINQEADKEARFQEAQQEYIIRAQKRSEFETKQQGQGFTKKGFTEVKNIRPVKGLDKSIQVRSVEYVKTLSDGREIIKRFDEEISDREKKRINKTTQAFKDHETERKKEISFQKSQDQLQQAKQKNQLAIARLQNAGYQISGKTVQEIQPVSGLNKNLTGDITRLQKRVSSGKNEGAFQVINVSDFENTKGPRKVSLNRNTPEYEAAQLAKRQQRIAQTSIEREEKRTASYIKSDRQFNALSANMSRLGYSVRDIQTDFKNVGGVLRPIVTREFTRSGANGTESIIRAKNDREGRTDLGTRVTKDQQRIDNRERSAKERYVREESNFNKANAAFQASTQTMTQAGFTASNIGSESKKIGGVMRNVEVREFRKPNADGSDEVYRDRSDRLGSKQRTDRSTPEAKKQTRDAAIQKNEPQRLSIESNPNVALKNAKGDILTYTNALKNGEEQVIRFNQVTGQEQSVINKNTRAHQEYQRAVAISSKEISNNARIQELSSQGYTQASQKINTLNIAGQNLVSRVTEMRRVSGNAVLGNLVLEIERLDSATNKSTRQVLNGQDAMRQMGDSFSNAAAKVSLWLVATQGIFTVISLLQRAWQETKQLEVGTILLARVSRGLGNGFAEQLVGAKQLTAQIVELSTKTGVSAVEAQKAAAIFGRTGQNKAQILESVRASLIASKIAEIDMVESASLLSSAQVQFNLTAAHSMPIIASLNTLSNNYKVTTNDLFQSISRAGSVYAQHNGSLEQLAATTAVVSQVTNRSGAEIGNALKTIQSRLTSPEVSGSLLETAGISTRTLSGETKNLTQILLQLSVINQQLTATERDQLSVRIAGARQVNILQAALNNVSQIIVAEAKALRDSESATAEFAQESESLQSALGRLDQLFTKIVSSGSDFNGVMKGLINTINTLLRMITAFDGLAIKVGLAVLAFTLVRLAVVKLNLQFGIGAAVANTWTAGLNRMSAAATASGAATLSLGSIMTKTNAIALALSVAIGLIVWAMNAKEEATAAAAAREQEHADQLERSTILTEKKARAAKEVSSALEEWIQALEELEKREKAGEKIDPSIKKFYGKQVEIITAQTQKYGENGTGINPLDSTGKIDKKAVEKIREISSSTISTEQRKQQESIEEQIKSSQKKITEDKKRLAAARREEATRDKSIYGIDPYTGKDAYHMTSDDSIEVLEKRTGFRLQEYKENPSYEKAKLYSDFSSELEKRKKFKAESLKIQSDITETETKKNDQEQSLSKVKSGFKQGSTITVEDYRKSIKDSNIIKNQVEQYKKFDSGNFEVSTGNSGEDALVTKKKIESLNETLRLSEVTLKNLAQVTDQDAFKTTAESAEYARREVQKLTHAAKELDIKNATQFVENRIKNTRGIIEEFAITRESISNIKKGKDPIQNDYNEIQRIGIKKKLAEEQLLQSQRLTDDPALSAEERIGVVVASNQEASNLINESKELEIEGAKKLLKLEQEIVTEKRNQNKEALKALGMLSDEDKLKVITIAQEIKKRGGKKFTEQEQFLTSEGDNKLLQQFFADYLDPVTATTGILGTAFSGLNLSQQNTDLVDKQKLLDGKLKENNSTNTEEMLKGALARIELLQQSLDTLNGKDKVDPNNKIKNMIRDDNRTDLMSITEGVEFPEVNLNLDMRPLVNSFKEVTTVLVMKIRDEMIQDINKIGEKIMTMIPGKNNQNAKFDPAN